MSSWTFGHNETVMFTISTPLRAALDRYADENNISRSEALRRAIAQMTGVPDPGHRRTYLDDEERHNARLERRAKRRAERRSNNG